MASSAEIDGLVSDVDSAAAALNTAIGLMIDGFRTRTGGSKNVKFSNGQVLMVNDFAVGRAADLVTKADYSVVSHDSGND
jgi:hypothetical protein